MENILTYDDFSKLSKEDARNLVVETAYNLNERGFSNYVADTKDSAYADYCRIYLKYSHVERNESISEEVIIKK